jgi:hypothetical protein
MPDMALSRNEEKGATKAPEVVDAAATLHHPWFVAAS